MSAPRASGRIDSTEEDTVPEAICFCEKKGRGRVCIGTFVAYAIACFLCERSVESSGLTYGGFKRWGSVAFLMLFVVVARANNCSYWKKILEPAYSSATHHIGEMILCPHFAPRTFVLLQPLLVCQFRSQLTEREQCLC